MLLSKVSCLPFASDSGPSTTSCNSRLVAMHARGRDKIGKERASRTLHGSATASGVGSAGSQLDGVRKQVRVIIYEYMVDYMPMLVATTTSM